MPTGIRLPSGIFLASGGSSSAPAGTNGATTRSFTNAEATPLAIGDVVYQFSNTSVKKAFSNGTLAQASPLGVAAAVIAAGASGLFVLWSIVVSAGAGKTFGTLGYLSTTAGAIAAAPDLTVGNYNVLLGAWINATDFEFVPQLPILN